MCNHSAKRRPWKPACVGFLPLHKVPAYSTVTDLARLRGLSTSVPFASAAW